MQIFSEEMFKKLDMYEKLDNVLEMNAMFDDCLKSISGHLIDMSELLKIVFNDPPD